MIVKGVIWFTDTRGSFGIVYGENEHGPKEKKAYISQITGQDEQHDINWIKTYGTKIYKPQVEELHNFFKGDE